MFKKIYKGLCNGLDLLNKKLIYNESFIKSDKNRDYSEPPTMKEYLVSDTLNNFDWKITKEHKKIFDYDCIKATTNFRGRNYEAWFTKSIKIEAGPWKFSGLPGLILAVNDIENIYNYVVKDLNLNPKIGVDSLTVPSRYSLNNAIDYQTFINFYKKNLEQHRENSKIMYVEINKGVTNKTTLSERIEKFN